MHDVTNLQSCDGCRESSSHRGGNADSSNESLQAAISCHDVTLTFNITKSLSESDNQFLIMLIMSYKSW
jgi:hypothetical protein